MNHRTIRLIVALPLGLLVASLAADAQPRPNLPVIGVLSNGYPSALTDPSSGVYAFRQGLRDLGYVEGQDLVLKYRFAEGQLDRHTDLAIDLVQRNVDIIVAAGMGAIQAAKHTRTIPIVMVTVSDPDQAALVASLAHPGGTSQGSPS